MNSNKKISIQTFLNFDYFLISEKIFLAFSFYNYFFFCLFLTILDQHCTAVKSVKISYPLETPTTANSSTSTKQRSPNKNFLSKLKKFELLSRGIRPATASSVQNLDEAATTSSTDTSSSLNVAAVSSYSSSPSSSSSQACTSNDDSLSVSSAASASSHEVTDLACSHLDNTSTTTTTNINSTTVNTFSDSSAGLVNSQSFTQDESSVSSKMMRSIRAAETSESHHQAADTLKCKQDLVRLRDLRSKSFGCEKDLRVNNAKSLNGTTNAANTSKKNAGSGVSASNSTKKTKLGMLTLFF